MTWEILSALIVIVTCLISLGAIVYKFTQTITRLEAAISGLNEWRAGAKSEHGKLDRRLDRHREELNDHELRIHDLEQEKKHGGGCNE